MRSFASFTMPAGITSSKFSRLKSTRPSKLITSFFCAKIAATMIPNRPPSPNIKVVRRFPLLLVLSFSNCAAGIMVTGSPSLEEESRGGSDEESPRKRRRRDDMVRREDVVSIKRACWYKDR